MDRYLSITEIGKHYGVRSSVAGAWLKRLGLRCEDGQPTEEAKRDGYCKQIYVEDRNVWFWVWNATRTLARLDEAVADGGMEEVDEGDAIERWE